MNINMIKLPVRELVQDYHEDDSTNKVTAWGDKLDVRPEYQREYVYDAEKRDLVIDTILKGFPLNIMYFVDRKDGTYEVLDGQQRIISICQYYSNHAISAKLPAATDGLFESVNYPNLFDEQREAFLNYELTVYICEGTEREKIGWFKTINIAGEELEEQEILNAVLHSAWLTDAKASFSWKNCDAARHYGKYMTGDPLRQKYLETAFRWAADAEGISGKDPVETYMKRHRFDASADDLWMYFENVFKWVTAVFGKWIPNMKGVQWGYLYNAHKDDNLDPAVMQRRAQELLADGEIRQKKGIYEYLLTGSEKALNLRVFDESEKQTMYARQNGVCPICGKTFDIREMHGDHIIPWSKGGKTTLDNGQMLCRVCNLKKGNA